MLRERWDRGLSEEGSLRSFIPPTRKMFLEENKSAIIPDDRFPGLTYETKNSARKKRNSDDFGLRRL